MYYLNVILTTVFIRKGKDKQITKICYLNVLWGSYATKESKHIKARQEHQTGH